MRSIQNELKDILFEQLKGTFEISPEEIQFSIPPQRKFGDLSTTLPFVIAKKTGQKPFLVGKEIMEKIEGKTSRFTQVKIEGGGFLNFHLKKGDFLNYMIEIIDTRPEKKSEKIIVEHTSINPNKSAHIGHLRNSCLGDTLARSFRFLEYEVEVQNYLDDTGIQVADVVWGLTDHEKKSIEDIKKIPDLPSYLWEKYPYYSRMLEENENHRIARDKAHKHIEDKGEPYYSTGNYISETVVKDHMELMDRFDIKYDSLIRERDIIELNLFDEAAGILKKGNIMYLSNDPEKKGCWVINYKTENIEKIIIRSNGTATYIAKDIAYGLWKVGLLSRDFYFRKFFEYGSKSAAYISDFSKSSEKKRFGKGDRVYTVIDVRQSYLQKIISEEVIHPLSSIKGGKEYIHFSYEMVALTPQCVKELGFEVSEEEKQKSYIEVSGRKGRAVKGSNLIDILTEKAKNEVRKRDPGLSEDDMTSIAKDIAVGALRYFMIKFNSNTVISFDFRDALSFEGDTGPYLQYTMVRINSIIKKLDKNDTGFYMEGEKIDELNEDEGELYFDILLNLSLMEIQVEHAIEKNEISAIASHTYSLCQKFNHYYHLYPIISEKKLTYKKLRINLLLLIKTRLSGLFSIMGIPVPFKM